MAAPPLANTFGGGSNGTTITAANSGGKSGNIFDAVSIGTNLVTYDNTITRGAYAAQLVTAATGAIGTLKWNTLGSLTSSVYFRCYIFLTAIPGIHLYFGQANNNAGTRCAGIEVVATTGKISFENAAGTDNTTDLLGTTTVATNQWVRLEWRIIPATSSATIEWRLYNTDADADSASYTETKISTVQVLLANIDQIAWGIPDSPVPGSFTYYVDDIAVSTADWIGPSSVISDLGYIPRRMPLG